MHSFETEIDAQACNVSETTWFKKSYIIGLKKSFTPSMSTKYISKPEQIKNHSPSKLSCVHKDGQFHVKGPRKKVNVKKWIFFYEMWEIIGQIDGFDRFWTTLVIWGGF